MDVKMQLNSSLDDLQFSGGKGRAASVELCRRCVGSKGEYQEHQAVQDHLSPQCDLQDQYQLPYGISH